LSEVLTEADDDGAADGGPAAGSMCSQQPRFGYKPPAPDVVAILFAPIGWCLPLSTVSGGSSPQSIRNGFCLAPTCSGWP